ncbi:MAG: hypothetical protein VW127_07845 [Flavobacteriaceae bacterium]|jgi:hypothetical protein
MLRWFRLVLLNRIYKNTKRADFESVKSKHPGALRNISVLLDHRLGIDEKHFVQMGKALGLSNNNIKVLTYYPSFNLAETSKSKSYFTSRDISSFGVLNERLNDFCNFKSDVLINFFVQNDINLKYISAKSNKKLSIGFNSVDHSLSDLIIEVDAQNIDVFTNECIKYIKIFFTTKK